MRSFLALLILASGITSSALAQSCTGLCLQQVSCTGSATTTISGKVYAPNGIDPLPNVTVYIPNAPVAAFTPGVSCPVIGTPPSGSPLVGTTTAVDGSFILPNVPVGTNIPVVAVSGRWRRQMVVPVTTACTNTTFSINMPRNQTEGDIPLIAIATGSVDSVECVLRKVGVDDSEFTNPGGGGRINFFQGDGNTTLARFSGGSRIDASTPAESVLMGDLPTLSQYDVLMLPCEGGDYIRAAKQLNNLISFANAGGRVYSSHFAYSWMINNPPFSTVATWRGSSTALSDGPATVITTFTEGQTLAQWLQIVGASTTFGQISVSTPKRDFNAVNLATTQPWLTLNSSGTTMQFVFDTPVNATTNQCGRVLYNEYHVETPIPAGGSANVPFPLECPQLTAAMTPQEKLLEFSLFELTDDGGQATLAPTAFDFGNEPVGFTTPPHTFVWTNNSTFAAGVSLLTASGDFAITSGSCGTVPAGGTCSISVTFTPTAIGARTGILTVGAGAQTLTAALTGTGVSDVVTSTSSLDFGSVDVGANVSKTITVTSNAPSAIPFPALSTTGDYTASSNCGSSLPALGSCTVTVTFKPSTTGTRPGTLSANSSNAAYAGLALQLTGNGIDFGIVVSPLTGSTLSGYSSATNATVTPIAGFAAPITLTCTSAAVASTCIPVLATFVPTAAVTTAVNITTTSEFTVVGYTGGSAGWLLSLFAIGSGWLLWIKRRNTSQLARHALMLGLMVIATLFVSGCSGKLPARNAAFTAAGDYTYTITASDGFLSHSATYTLHLTAK